jgi:hypothetical protein
LHDALRILLSGFALAEPSSDFLPRLSREIECHATDCGDLRQWSRHGRDAPSPTGRIADPLCHDARTVAFSGILERRRRWTDKGVGERINRRSSLVLVLEFVELGAAEKPACFSYPLNSLFRLDLRVRYFAHGVPSIS